MAVDGRTRPVATDDRRPRFCRLCEIHDWPFLCAMDTVANRLLCAASKRLERKDLPNPTRASGGTTPWRSGNRLAPPAGEPRLPLTRQAGGPVIMLDFYA